METFIEDIQGDQYLYRHSKYSNILFTNKHAYTFDKANGLTEIATAGECSLFIEGGDEACLEE